MIIERIPFYEDFRCVAGACAETCCRGWSILVEEEARERFRREKGWLGFRLRLALRGQDDTYLNASRGTCAFFTRGGLCALQKARGEKYPPLTCQIYPRRRRNFGVLAEETLDLSCVEAARLFLGASGISFHGRTGEVSYARHGSNTDEAFFELLLQSRQRLLKMLQEVKVSSAEVPFETAAIRLSDAFSEMMHLANTWQRNAATGKPLFDAQEEEETADRTFFPLPVPLVNAWVNGCLYHADLKRRIPFFYRLLTFYMKRFDGLNERNGQMRMDRLFRDGAKKGVFRIGKYVHYAQYDLLRYYTETYEDYSFLNRIRSMILHTNLLLLFDALYADERGELPEEAEARILAVYEKRARHSAQMEKNMLHAWLEKEGEVPYV
ncbi:MAG: flagellin lysine-N-methylase [Lachnospiraceae bacterium]|nr:flagellin lysine-N-methylase [Lachnospiraceae bacterium]